MLLFLVLFALWLLLNGRVTLELILIGAAVSGAVWLFCYRTLGYRPQRERVLLRRLPRYAALPSGACTCRCGRRARACCLRTPSRSRPVP